MTYIITTVVLGVILFFVSALPKLEKFRTKHDDFYNFLLTMVATFIGVNYGEKSK